jgi:hypothetical protein
MGRAGWSRMRYKGCDRQAIVQLEGEIAWSGAPIEAQCHLADEEGPA